MQGSGQEHRDVGTGTLGGRVLERVVATLDGSVRSVAGCVRLQSEVPMTARPPGHCLTIAGLVGMVLMLALLEAAGAQELIRFAGSVQWISGSRMQVMTDSAGSIAVDLAQADQSSYQGLRNGDAILVDGVLSADRRRIVARELWRDSGRGYWGQSP
jgi:hypothetical protein